MRAISPHGGEARHPSYAAPTVASQQRYRAASPRGGAYPTQPLSPRGAPKAFESPDTVLGRIHALRGAIEGQHDASPLVHRSSRYHGSQGTPRRSPQARERAEEWVGDILCGLGTRSPQARPYSPPARPAYSSSPRAFETRYVVADASPVPRAAPSAAAMNSISPYAVNVTKLREQQVAIRQELEDLRRARESLSISPRAAAAGGGDLLSPPAASPAAAAQREAGLVDGRVAVLRAQHAPLEGRLPRVTTQDVLDHSGVRRRVEEDGAAEAGGLVELRARNDALLDGLRGRSPADTPPAAPQRAGSASSQAPRRVGSVGGGSSCAHAPPRTPSWSVEREGSVRSVATGDRPPLPAAVPSSSRPSSIRRVRSEAVEGLPVSPVSPNRIPATQSVTFSHGAPRSVSPVSPGRIPATQSATFSHASSAAEEEIVHREEFEKGRAGGAASPQAAPADRAEIAALRREVECLSSQLSAYEDENRALVRRLTSTDPAASSAGATEPSAADGAPEPYPLTPEQSAVQPPAGPPPSAPDVAPPVSPPVPAPSQGALLSGLLVLMKIGLLGACLAVSAFDVDLRAAAAAALGDEHASVDVVMCGLSLAAVAVALGVYACDVLLVVLGVGWAVAAAGERWALEDVGEAALGEAGREAAVAAAGHLERAACTAGAWWASTAAAAVDVARSAQAALDDMRAAPGGNTGAAEGEGAPEDEGEGAPEDSVGSNAVVEEDAGEATLQAEAAGDEVAGDMREEGVEARAEVVQEETEAEATGSDGQDALSGQEQDPEQEEKEGEEKPGEEGFGWLLR